MRAAVVRTVGNALCGEFHELGSELAHYIGTYRARSLQNALVQDNLHGYSRSLGRQASLGMTL